MASIQERKTAAGETRFRVQVRVKGRPPQTASFRRLTDAKRWAQRIEADVRRGRHFPDRQSRKRTLGELIDRYLKSGVTSLSAAERENRRQQLAWWRSRIGRHRLADLRPRLIAEGRDSLATEGAARGPLGPGTCNRYLAALSAALSYGVSELEWLESNPCKQVRRAKEPRGRVRFLDDDERARLLEACRSSYEPRLHLLVLLALLTGMRRGELLRLRWRDIDFGRGFAVVHQTKNGRRRTVPLPSPAVSALKERKERTEILQSGLVFEVVGRKAGAPWPRKAWQTALAEAEIENFRFHDCRHTAASYLAQSGARLYEIAEILGHRTLQMVQRYAHLTDRQTAAVAERMADQFFAEG